MSPTRDARGRFVKAGKGQPDPAFLTIKIPAPLPPSGALVVMDAGVFLNQWKQQYEQAQAQHEKTLQDAVSRYETVLTKAEADLASLVKKASEVSTVETESGSSPGGTAIKAEDQKPACCMMNAPDGEQLMVLNQQAVVMFLAIFDRLADVLPEVQKLVKAKR